MHAFQKMFVHEIVGATVCSPFIDPAIRASTFPFYCNVFHIPSEFVRCSDGFSKFTGWMDSQGRGERGRAGDERRRSIARLVRSYSRGEATDKYVERKR